MSRMNKKRILFLSAFYPNPGAPNIATYNRQILLAMTDYYDIDAVVPIPWIDRFRKRLIKSEYTQSNINIYHPNYYYTPFIMRFMFGYYYYYSIKSTVKKLTKYNCYDIIYSSWLYPDAWVASIVAKKLNLPLFVSVLGTDVNRLKPNTALLARSLEVTSYANKVICVCNVLKQKLISLGCPSDKLVYLQNGIDHTIFYPRNKDVTRLDLGVGVDEKLIVYVGNLKKEKGLGELVEAFSNIITKNIYNSIKLIIIGDGRFRRVLTQKVKRYGLSDNTLILGEQSLHAISHWLCASDVLCLPSYSEGQPNVVIEALTCHTRVVATNVGGIPDLDDGLGNLKLVPPGNVTALTDALVEMVDRGSNNFQEGSIYSWNDYAVRLKGLFEQ